MFKFYPIHLEGLVRAAAATNMYIILAQLYKYIRLRFCVFFSNRAPHDGHRHRTRANRNTIVGGEGGAPRTAKSRNTWNFVIPPTLRLYNVHIRNIHCSRKVVHIKS